MTLPDAHAVRALFKQVQTILLTDWDPIGAYVPQDEYDSYAWPVVKLLQNHASRDELAIFLRCAADEAMKCPVPAEQLETVINKLMVLAR